MVRAFAAASNYNLTALLTTSGMRFGAHRSSDNHTPEEGFA